MTYPGLVLLIGVGLGIASFLYYMFAENDRENAHQYNFSEDRSQDGWGISSPRSENSLLNRRNSSNSLRRRTEEEREHGSKEDISNCSICQYALIDLDIIQLRPCRHRFHKDCINKLRNHDPMAPCPNCRRIFKHTI